MLTIVEQLKILSNDPLEIKQPSKILLDLVHQSAVKYARDFQTNYKVFQLDDGGDPPKPINVEAIRYVQKTLTLSNSIFLNDQRVAGSLHKLIVSIMGDTDITFGQIAGFTDSDWETAIKGNLPRAFELFAGITKDEKDHYDKV